MMRTQTEQRQQLADRAYELFREFRSAYTGEWQRLTNCERMYRGDTGTTCRCATRTSRGP